MIQDGTVTNRRRIFVLGIVLLLTATTACVRIGYPLRPETVKTGKQQPIRLGVGHFTDARPLEETDIYERERLIGDDARYYTDYGASDVGAAVSNVVVKHLTFAGSFTSVSKVAIEGDTTPDYLRREIKALSGEVDAVLLGRVSHFWGYDGYNAEGDHRIVEGQAHLVEMRIIRCRDLKVLWSGEAIANLREIDSVRRGNEYTMANDMLRDALNKVVADLNRARLPR
jgi:hypothetical protein